MGARNQARRLPGHRPQNGKRVRLYSRPGNHLTKRFPLIVDTLARLRSRSCIIDGEAVACGADGIACFEMIRRWDADDSVFMWGFDLIELNGDDLRRDPLDVRKATLVDMLARASPPSAISRLSTTSNGVRSTPTRISLPACSPPSRTGPSGGQRPSLTVAARAGWSRLRAGTEEWLRRGPNKRMG
jgi:hypothetical protein